MELLSVSESDSWEIQMIWRWLLASIWSNLGYGARQLDLAPSHEALIAIARRYSRFRSRLPFGACYVSRLACSRRSLIGFFVALRMHLRSGPGPFRPGIHSHAC